MNHSHLHARARTKGALAGTAPKPTSKTEKARAA